MALTEYKVRVFYFLFKLEMEVFPIAKLKSELWMKRIMDCRSSGLSDLQWCKEHDIKPPTFYYWIKKLRIEKSISDSETTSLSLRKESKQAVVPVDIIDEEPCVPTYEKIVEYPSNSTDTAITIQLNSFTVHIKNNASSSVIHTTIQALRLLC